MDRIVFGPPRYPNICAVCDRQIEQKPDGNWKHQFLDYSLDHDSIPVELDKIK